MITAANHSFSDNPFRGAATYRRPSRQRAVARASVSLREIAMCSALLAIAALLMSLATASSALADGPPPPASQEGGLLASLNPQAGLIELPNGVARLEVPEEFRYLDPADTQEFLEQGWGNPNGSGTLGMLLPTETDLFGVEGWGVVISYREDGHVDDRDAQEIDYKELLASMQEAETEANKKRSQQGYDPVHLVGWAEPPHYDVNTKKLYWAKELKFGTSTEHTLNYGVRVLGRKGVLVLNAVAGMPQLPAIKERMEQVVAIAEFNEGHRYRDYDARVDRLAGYGIAALIGGKVAAKAGLLAKLGASLVAFKKVVLLGLAAIGGAIAKVFRRPKVKAAASAEAQ
jgi:uncharacterized membrane-anchored protein